MSISGLFLSSVTRVIKTSIWYCRAWAGGEKGDDVLLGISKQRRATKRKVAMLEKSLPWRLRSILSPMTAAYYVTPRQYLDQHMAPRSMQIAPREHVKGHQAHVRSG